VLDPAGTADIIEEARNYTFFIPIVLAVLCGMRRGEIAALRWRSLDLDAGQLSVVASIEQTRAGCREKDAKSGRGRAVALPALVVEELRRHRLAQAQAMLAIGVRVTADHHVVMQGDALPLQPNSITQAIAKFMKEARQQGPIARAAALARNAYAGVGHSSQDRLRAPGAQQGGDHARSLQPCSAGDAGRGGHQGRHADIGCATSPAEERPVAIR
jgi:integrase